MLRAGITLRGALLLVHEHPARQRDAHRCARSAPSPRPCICGFDARAYAGSMAESCAGCYIGALLESSPSPAADGGGML